MDDIVCLCTVPGRRVRVVIDKVDLPIGVFAHFPALGEFPQLDHGLLVYLEQTIRSKRDGVLGSGHGLDPGRPLGVVVDVVVLTVGCSSLFPARWQSILIQCHWMIPDGEGCFGGRQGALLMQSPLLFHQIQLSLLYDICGHIRRWPHPGRRSGVVVDVEGVSVFVDSSLPARGEETVFILLEGVLGSRGECGID